MLTVNGEISARQIVSGIKLQIAELNSYKNLLEREEDKVSVQAEIDALMVDLEIMEREAKEEINPMRTLESLFMLGSMLEA